MIKTIFKNMPREMTLGLSGGVDSMVAYHFLSKNHTIKPVFVNHGTKASNEAEDMLRWTLGSKVTYRSIYKAPEGVNMEKFWREERYRIFREESNNTFIITGHHLDDVCENWIMTCARGNPQIIPPIRQDIIRPFLGVEKTKLREYAEKHGIPYCEDESNIDEKYERNYVRTNIAPSFKHINPGFYKVMRKKIFESLGGVQKYDFNNEFKGAA